MLFSTHTVVHGERYYRVVVSAKSRHFPASGAIVVSKPRRRRVGRRNRRPLRSRVSGSRCRVCFFLYDASIFDDFTDGRTTRVTPCYGVRAYDIFLLLILIFFYLFFFDYFNSIGRYFRVRLLFRSFSLNVQFRRRRPHTLTHARIRARGAFAHEHTHTHTRTSRFDVLFVLTFYECIAAISSRVQLKFDDAFNVDFG